MTTTEKRVDSPEPRPVRRPARSRGVLGGILVGSFAIRLVGIQHGLPFAFNTDEELHFVPQAAAAADGDLDPNYYQNPSALTYLLAIIYRLLFVADDMTNRFASDPTSLFLVGRVVVALLGTLLVAFVYLVGTRYFDRTVGLIAAAIIGFAFLPVFYSHQALNDVPALIGITIGVLGCLQLYETGGWRAYLLAGLGLGLATGTKYLAAPLAITVIGAVVLAVRAGRDRPQSAIRRLCAAGVVTIATIIILNPFVAIEATEAWRQYDAQAEAAAIPKLGQGGTGWTYYPWTLLWGFGAVPLALAIGGSSVAFRHDRARTLILLSFPVILYLHMAGQGRFFGRWMLPIYPALAIFAGYGAVRLAEYLRARAACPARVRTVILPAIVILTLTQPLADSIRSDLTLLQTDTRTQAHAWLADNLPPGTRLAPEPSLPKTYWDDLDLDLYPITQEIQQYELALEPGRVDTYRTLGFCWVLVNSHRRDRGLAEGLPEIRRYYDRLEAESRLVVSFSPYRPGSTPPEFSFDFSFDYYPFAYERPGPYLEIRRLNGCRTGVGAAPSVSSRRVPSRRDERSNIEESFRVGRTGGRSRTGSGQSADPDL